MKNFDIKNTSLKQFLNCFRLHRNFDVKNYIEVKSSLLNNYFASTEITACVVGISGGIDSAVVLGLLNHAMQEPGSPLKRIIPAIMPIHNSLGATHQSEAAEKALCVAHNFGLSAVQIDLSKAHRIMQDTVDISMSIQGNAWSAGQLVSNIRTPVLYYIATLLQQDGFKSLVCGTTNRDEGAYLGFFGKASEAVVDLQIISDLHKSEVYKVAEALEIPQIILQAPPTGDTYTGATDEEMLGVSYDFVELYLNFLGLDFTQQKHWLSQLSTSAHAEFSAGANLLESRHKTNQHKYVDGTATLHFDVYQREILQNPQVQNKIHSNQWIGLFSLDKNILNSLTTLIYNDNRAPNINQPPIAGQSISVLNNFLSSKVCNLLCQQLDTQTLVTANQYGYPRKSPDKNNRLLSKLAAESKMQGDSERRTGVYGSVHEDSSTESTQFASVEFRKKSNEIIGSSRATIYNPTIANALFHRLMQTTLSRIKILDEYSYTDGYPAKYWRMVGINPLLRFIVYPFDGLINPHYDAGYDFCDDKRYTLMSMLIYLTDGDDLLSGATRFLLDKERYKPTSERIFIDSDIAGDVNHTLFEVKPLRGKALIFDHRLLHEATHWQSTSPRIVLRTDIIFEKCGAMMQQMHSIKQPPRSLQSILLNRLELKNWKSSKQIDDAYEITMANQSHTESTENKALIDSSWQILRDPFYATACQRFTNMDEVLEAGFFPDNRSLLDIKKDTVNWLITPINKIQNYLDKNNDITHKVNKSLVVLISTGGFAPLHQGHIDMLEIAKEHLEKRGHCVLGGYISPDNDNYIHNKCGELDYPYYIRLQECERFVQKSSWIMIDPWQILAQKTSVNFTIVVERMAAYLAAHIKTFKPIKVIYVCGADNSRLAMSFAERGHCVVVPRIGYEDKYDYYKKNQPLINRDRVDFCEKNTPNISSTNLRAEKKHLSHLNLKKTQSLKLRIRDEQDWPLQLWQNHPEFFKIQAKHEEFKASILNLLEKSFDKELEISITSLKQQQQIIAKRYSDFDIISLDPCIQGTYNIGISRYFSIPAQNDYIFKERYRCDLIKKQCSSIPKGKYILIDDDSFSGETINFVKSQLPSDCEIIDEFVFFDGRKKANKQYELCDFRDFLVGGYGSGLGLILPNQQLTNAPYILPYVRPSYRLSIAQKHEKIFSLHVWKLNLKFFLSIKPSLLIADANDSLKNLANYIGLPRDTTLADFCQWHINHLEQSLDLNSPIQELELNYVRL